MYRNARSCWSKPVMILAQSGACSLNRFLADISRERGRLDPNFLARSETCDANFLYWTSMQRLAQSGVMHYFSITHVNAMVIVVVVWRDEMGAWRWQRVRCQLP